MKECSKLCQKHDIKCPAKECQYWIDFPGEQNCSLVSIAENGRMTLEQVGERLNLSFVRISQIEKKALQKIKNLIKIDDFDE